MIKKDKTETHTDVYEKRKDSLHLEANNSRELHRVKGQFSALVYKVIKRSKWGQKQKERKTDSLSQQRQM